MTDNNDDLNRKISDAYLKILDLKKEDLASKTETVTELKTETSPEGRNYQDILDKYAASINTPVEDKIPEAPLPSEISNVDEIMSQTENTPEKSVETQPVLQDISSEPQSELPVSETLEEVVAPVSEETVLPLDTSPSPEAILSSVLPTEPTNENEIMPEATNFPKENNFFKYLFFFSLFIFIIVLVSVIISFVNSQKSISNSTTSPTIVLTPTDIPSTVCEINDQKYNVGQSFTATDGCNTCTCNSDQTIVCTEMACEATPTAKLSPTKTATSSAKKVPTATPIPTKIITR